METELGYNFLDTSFTSSTSASPELSNEEDDGEDDNCCNSGCGCHD
tara:strand:+ start:549 stop:686 length:138 start_codon:yes stop_codon:yes gene_type:complete